MFKEFTKYFFKYIIFSKSRQKLLFLALLGLVLSSFSLLVLQSTMGGLQHNLKSRSKAVMGSLVFQLDKLDNEDKKKLLLQLKKQKVEYFPEYELELLIKNGPYIAPVVAHGISERYKYSFISELTIKESILPSDLAFKLHLSSGEEFKLISPAHTDSFMGDVPRVLTLYVDDYIQTDVPEVDNFHLWVNLRKIQNLTGEKTINRVRFFHKNFNYKKFQEYYPKLEIKTWEQMNENLVYALKLESTIMVFLFMSMTFLVSLCITSGLLIFFGKIKTDLMSFWILGTSKQKLRKASWNFTMIMALSSVSCGIVFALIFLYGFDKFGVELLPDVFIDRKIPIYITGEGLFYSFTIPAVMSLIFSYLTFRSSLEDSNYIRLLRN